MPTIDFEASVEKIDSLTLIRLPMSASAKLPSRGMVMVRGTLNGSDFSSALEPDGKKSHWFGVDKKMQEINGLEPGDTVTMSIEPTKEWPEPEVPADLQMALAADSEAYAVWKIVTPMARWDWIRWIRSTAQAETRQRRIEVACSKLNAGMRRPCCFNRTDCTDPAVSKNGVLLDPVHT